MTICTSCGAQNDAGAAFCGDCGAFLEWAGAAEEDEPTGESAEASAGASAEAPVDGRLSAAPEAAGEAGEAAREAGGTVAASPVTTADGSLVPAAVLPGEATRRRPRRPSPAPPRPPVAGELACPRCGAGNDRARRFCRACGALLSPPRARDRRPWWRRLAARLFRRRSYAAGTRRRVRKPVRVPRKLVALGLAGALAAVAAGPGREVVTDAVSRVRQEVRDQVAKPAPVSPTGWEASSALPDHGPDLLSTRVADQFWAPDGDPAGSWVEAELPRPVRLLHVVIYAGQSTDPELFQQQGRPHEVEVSAIAEDGATVTVELVVRDQPGKQQFAVEADDVVRVRFLFQSAHGMEPDRFMAVGELELFAR